MIRYTVEVESGGPFGSPRFQAGSEIRDTSPDEDNWAMQEAIMYLMRGLSEIEPLDRAANATITRAETGLRGVTVPVRYIVGGYAREWMLIGQESPCLPKYVAYRGDETL